MRYLPLIALTPTFAWAAFVPAYTIITDTQEFDVQTSGAYTHVYERNIRIDTPQGIDQYGQAKIPYDGKRDTLEIVEAYTIKPNGEKVPVTPDRVKRQSAATEDVAPYFTDQMTASIIFPQVEVGSQLYYKTILKATPVIQGRFSDITPYTPHRRYENSSIKLTHPADMHLRAFSRGVTGTTNNLPDGRVQHAYKFQQDTASPLEPNQVDFEDFSPVIQFSNYKSYAELAEVTQGLFKDKTKVTPKIQKLANEITSGQTSQKKKAEALYNWVSKNIRYVGIDVGASGYEPHFSDEILANRYGDCKDHAVILEALLSAIGIDSSPALIRTTDSYLLPQLAGNYYFDHIITYVPEFDLYLDSTAQFAEFGTLPPEDIGKPTLLTQTGTIGKTPYSKPTTDFTETHTKLQLKRDGSIVGTTKFIPHGYYTSISRAAQFAYENKDTQQVVDTILKRYNVTGTGELVHNDPSDLASKWVVKSTYKLDPVINLPGPSAMTIPYGLTPAYIKTNTSFKPYQGRKYPFTCGSSRHIEHIQFELPPSVRLTRLPSSTVVATTDQKYKSTYKASGSTILITRELTTTTGTDVCTPSEHRYIDLVRTVYSIKADLRSQIFVE